MKRKRKRVIPNVDGLGPKDIKRLVTAIRRVWSWNYARRICLERAIGKDGFPVCEKCFKKVPKVYPDHIKPIGEFSLQYIARCFVPSNRLQALCGKCHRVKTNRERTKLRNNKKITGAGF
jgi:hypothetical protein